MTMKLSPTQIKEIAERAEKATKGPWVPAEDPRPGMIYNVHVESPAGTVCFPAHGELDEDGDDDGFATGNMAFVAHSRQDIPNLLAHIAAQDGEIENLTKQIPSQDAKECAAQALRDAIKTLRKLGLVDELGNPAERPWPHEREIAQLERERDEAESRLPSDVSWLFEQLLGTDLVDHEPYKEVLTKWRTDTTLRARIAQLESQIAMKDGALKKIERWFGEFPPTDRFWDEDKGTKNEPMSYAACYGSNGERDFMRDVAREALKGSAK